MLHVLSTPHITFFFVTQHSRCTICKSFTGALNSTSMTMLMLTRCGEVRAIISTMSYTGEGDCHALCCWLDNTAVAVQYNNCLMVSYQVPV